VDQVLELDEQSRQAKTRCDYLRSQRNALSKQIGGLMAKGQKEEAEQIKSQVTAMAQELEELEEKTRRLEGEVRQRMTVIPNIIDPSVPIGKDDSENVERRRFGEPAVPDYDIPYHVEIMEQQGHQGDQVHHLQDQRRRLLLSEGRRGPAPFRRAVLCPGFYDRQGF
jgi:seryl-tRNA synthetase